MRTSALRLFFLSTLMLFGCSDGSRDAVVGAHPENWIIDHPGDIPLTTDGFVENCGICHGRDLHGVTHVPSCFSADFAGYSCHAAGPVPHRIDGSYLDADNHGPAAKADLTVCQACHADIPAGGPGSNPRFNVGINSAGGDGCESCHPAGYAHPETWAGPAGDRFHYSAGKVRDACALCHGAALDGGAGISCLDCHAEVTGFTLQCDACHGYPPDGSNGISHAASDGRAVSDIDSHNTCVTCHGMKESADGGTFGNVPNYALYDTAGDIPGDHWNGVINMNSDTGYNAATGGCDRAGCHGGSAPFSLPDSGLAVATGAYGIPGGAAPHPLDGSFLDPDNHGPAAKSDLTLCQICHSDNPNGGPGSEPRFNVGINSAGGDGCESCHPSSFAHPETWAGPAGDRFHYSAGAVRDACSLCHGTDLDGSGVVGSSCLDCHAEVTGFTLQCDACHGYPPDGSNGISHAASGGRTVSGIAPHDGCALCHGMKESDSGGTFGNEPDYALFDKVADVPGDHWNGVINMNSDTGYNAATGGCDSAVCHGGAAPFTLPDSGLSVAFGAYGAAELHPVGAGWLLPGAHVASWQADPPSCFDCHAIGSGGLSPSCRDCHTRADPTVVSSGCVSCHGDPPMTGEHGGHAFDCSSCHYGSGSGSLSHWYPSQYPPANVTPNPTDPQSNIVFTVGAPPAYRVSCVGECHSEPHNVLW